MEALGWGLAVGFALLLFKERNLLSLFSAQMQNRQNRPSAANGALITQPTQTRTGDCACGGGGGSQVPKVVESSSPPSQPSPSYPAATQIRRLQGYFNVN